MIGIINAGGKGTRLSSIAVDIPKPMVKIAGKPVLQYQIECLKDNGILDIYIIVGHLGNAIKDYFVDGHKFGVNIQYIQETEPLGSAGSLFYFRNIVHDDFIFIFGDLMIDVYFERMIKFHKDHRAIITLLSHPNSHPYDSDLIIADDNNLVVDIDSKQNVRDYYYHNLVNSGVYIVSNHIFDNYFKDLSKNDFEKNILKNEIKNKSVYSYHSTEYVKDIGTPDRYMSVCKDVERGIVKMKNLRFSQRCIFLDRDGTINKYKGFIKDIESIDLEDGVIDGIKLVNASSFLAIVITNQPVIARGEVNVQDLNTFHKKIETLLGKKGAFFDDLFYCPHHPDKGFEGEIKELKFNCDCRKPRIGLLLRAQEKYNIDLSKSFFVGDSTTDVQTGINAGMKTVLVKTGNKGKDGKYNVKPDYIINDLSELSIIFGED